VIDFFFSPKRKNKQIIIAAKDANRTHALNNTIKKHKMFFKKG